MSRVPRGGAQECCLGRQTARSVGPNGPPAMPPKSRRPRPGECPRLTCGRCPVRGVVRWLSGLPTALSASGGVRMFNAQFKMKSGELRPHLSAPFALSASLRFVREAISLQRRSGTLCAPLAPRWRLGFGWKRPHLSAPFALSASLRLHLFPDLTIPALGVLCGFLISCCWLTAATSGERA
jgi:hypothetical protein